MSIPAFIHRIYLSRGHNFFGRHGQSAGRHPMTSREAVICRAGQGLEGDRFFGYRPDYAGQVTFFAWDTYLGAKRNFPSAGVEPDVFRRNVVVDGLPLNDLVGTRFLLGGIEFEGVAEARPCYWMNSAVAPGAEEWLRGRGGLRAKIRTDGELRCGAAAFCAPEFLPL